jgi:hypothetical protein
MEKDKFPGILGLVLLIIIIAYGLSRDKSNPSVAIVNSKDYKFKPYSIDSLNNVIDSLQTEIFMLEDGFDSKEHRYEDVIFEYELGMSYLKDYHPKAYKDFHRIIGMRERFTAELERENSKRLKINKF